MEFHAFSQHPKTLHIRRFYVLLLEENGVVVLSLGAKFSSKKGKGKPLNKNIDAR
jgi:hypothetical protein